MSERLPPEEHARLTYRIENRLDRFVELMKSRMHANISKGDWKEDPPAGTALKLVSHVGDLASDLLGEGVGGEVGRLHRCVSIANFAFILADNLCGHLFTDHDTKEDDDVRQT